MDWLDRISIWAIVLLIIGSFALIAGHLGEARPERIARQRTAVAEPPPAKSELEAREKLIRNLLESDNPGKAEELISELLRKFPYEGQPHMLMGDLLMRKQDPVKAMRAYREAVDLDPDYLDRKTPLFQGKKLKTAANEALAEVERRLRTNPGDGVLKKEKKDIYYLQRRIAGSCS